MHPNTRRAIQKKILAWYARRGRHDLPWRLTEDMYRIVVSEIMLQQTNVPKVIEKYKAFLKEFPSWRALANAPQSAVLTQWRGLGYNRRALNLHKCAQVITCEYGGRVPQTPEECMRLPGIGPYASRAILAFGRNADVAAVDVNIERLMRRWHVSGGAENYTTQEAAEWMLPQGASRDWHNALMDFASRVCTKRSPKCAECPLAKICPSYPDPDDYVHVKKKEPGRSEGGKHIPRRIYRGRIVEVLRDHALTTDEIGQRIKSDWETDQDGEWLEGVLSMLAADQMIQQRGAQWALQ